MDVILNLINCVEIKEQLTKVDLIRYAKENDITNVIRLLCGEIEQLRNIVPSLEDTIEQLEDKIECMVGEYEDLSSEYSSCYDKLIDIKSICEDID